MEGKNRSKPRVQCRTSYIITHPLSANKRSVKVSTTEASDLHKFKDKFRSRTWQPQTSAYDARKFAETQTLLHQEGSTRTHHFLTDAHEQQHPPKKFLKTSTSKGTYKKPHDTAKSSANLTFLVSGGSTSPPTAENNKNPSRGRETIDETRETRFTRSESPPTQTLALGDIDL